MTEAAGEMKVVLVDTPPDDAGRLNENVVFVGPDGETPDDAEALYRNADAQGRSAVQAAVNLLRGRPLDEGTGYPSAPSAPYTLCVPFADSDTDS